MKYITLFNIDGEIGHPIYHRSNQNIIKPTYEGIDEARSWSKTHHNSVLGLWGSTLPELCSSFGKYNYLISVKEDAVRLGLVYSDWKSLGCDIYHDCEDFIRLRNKILYDKSLDIIYILDSGYVGEIIIVNLDCIESVTEVGSVPDRRYSLKHDPHKSINIEY